MDNNPSPLTYTLKEAANALHVSRPTVSQLVHTQSFPAFRVGRRWIISASGLQRWIDEQANADLIATENSLSDAPEKTKRIVS